MRSAPPPMDQPEADTAAVAQDSGVQIAHGARAMAIAQVVGQVVRFLTNVLLARLLAPRDFGIVAIALVIAMFLDQFKDLGTGSAIIQRKDLTNPLLNAVFYLNVVMGAVLSLSLFASADWVASLVSSAGEGSVLRVFAGITMVTALGQIHHALLRRDLRFGLIARITVISTVLTAAVSLASAMAGLGVWSLVYGAAAGALWDTVAVWVYDKWRPTRDVSVSAVRPILGYSTNLFFVNIVGIFFSQSDKLLVGHFLGASPLGIYSMAQRVLTYPLTSVSSIVGEVAFPAFARNQDDDAALRSGYLRVSGVVALVTFPLMGLTAALARPAVSSVLGERWAALTPLMWILAPVGALQSVTFTANQLFMAKGRTDLLFRWITASSAVTVLSYLAGLHWHLIGLCVSYAIATVLLVPFNLRLAFRQVELRFRPYLAQLLPLAAIAGIASAAAFGADALIGARAPDGVKLVCCGLVGVASYAAALAVLRPPAVQDARIALRSRRSSTPA